MKYHLFHIGRAYFIIYLCEDNKNNTEIIFIFLLFFIIKYHCNQNNLKINSICAHNYKPHGGKTSSMVHTVQLLRRFLVIFLLLFLLPTEQIKYKFVFFPFSSALNNLINIFVLYLSSPNHVHRK